MLVLLICAFFLIVAVGNAESVLKAERVLVKKADRQLQLISKGKVLHTFTIALGETPEGDKEEEGDLRTPEGRYVIDWRNPQSRFYKSLHISYPDAADRRQAEAEDVDPGGMIMIHGLPPEAEEQPELYQNRDWTHGCIAVTNQAMDVIWALVDDGTPIEIRP